jgi:hypothetical protein
VTVTGATDKIQKVVNLTGKMAAVSENLRKDAEHRQAHIKAVSAPSSESTSESGSGGDGGDGGASHQPVDSARFAKGSNTTGTKTTEIIGTFRETKKFGHAQKEAAN